MMKAIKQRWINPTNDPKSNVRVLVDSEFPVNNQLATVPGVDVPVENIETVHEGHATSTEVEQVIAGLQRSVITSGKIDHDMFKGQKSNDNLVLRESARVETGHGKPRVVKTPYLTFAPDKKVSDMELRVSRKYVTEKGADYDETCKMIAAIENWRLWEMPDNQYLFYDTEDLGKSSKAAIVAGAVLGLTVLVARVSETRMGMVARKNTLATHNQHELEYIHGQ